MKQKIAILAHSMAGGGAERFISHLLNNLKDDFEIHLIIFQKVVQYELPENQIVKFINETDFKLSNLRNLLSIPSISYKLKAYCRENNIQLVISFLNRPNFAACLAKRFGLKAKVLISERTFTPNYYIGNSLNGKIAKLLISRLYPLADAILPNSHGTRDALRNHYKVENNYIVIKNMVDLDDLRRQQQEEVEDARFDKFTFVHLGSFSYMKGHRLLIEAFAELKADDAQLLLIGKGNLLEEIKQRVASLGIEDKVLFLGHQSNPFKYLSRSDCFVLASDFEGFPNVLIEAMACGLPIISTDCQTGPRELLAPATGYQTQVTDKCEFAEYGVLVPVGNKEVLTTAMREMMQNEELRNTYRAKCANKAVEFDRKIVIEEFKQIINDYLPSASKNI